MTKTKNGNAVTCVAAQFSFTGADPLHGIRVKGA